MECRRRCLDLIRSDRIESSKEKTHVSSLLSIDWKCPSRIALDTKKYLSNISIVFFLLLGNSRSFDRLNDQSIRFVIKIILIIFLYPRSAPILIWSESSSFSVHFSSPIFNRFDLFACVCVCVYKVLHRFVRSSGDLFSSLIR